MQNWSVGDWFQAVASVAVIVGLVLVIVELRQAKTLVRAQLASDYNAAWEQQRSTIMGENSAAVLAKVCTAPHSLTVHDIAIYQAWVGDLWGRAFRLRQIEGIADLGIPWQVGARTNIRLSLNSEHGRWYARNIAPSAWSDELNEIASDLLATGDYFDCGETYNAFLNLERLENSPQ